MTLIAADTSKQDGQASGIIEKMKSLLHQRFRQQVTRTQFLRGWTRLRKALRLTPQYQAVIDKVRARSKNKCEKPGCKHDGCHLHHIERVALRPDLALNPENCIWICEPCHLREHKKA